MEAEGECSTEEAVLCRERAGAVMEAVWKLPMRYRDVIHLFYYEDLSVNEIAEILGRKTSTVTSQLTRGREILKKSLKEEYDFA
ncbi:MAG: sigma-70 family RNA polymerase sigma factor [Lachnospiraceae bacterium]|nr:sigma-70 family RNA polymerase sigma factor [Lachnospiraceae bacterium]